MTTLTSAARAVLHRLRYTEPAVLRAHAVAVLALLAGAGITIPGVVDRWVGATFTVLAVAAPYYQGLRTRADVWSPATVDTLVQLAGQFPGLETKAKELLGKGLGAGIVRELLEQATEPPATASTATAS